MNAVLHPAHRHTIFAALFAGIVTATTLLPLSGAETKGKKTSTKGSAEATPKPKKSSEKSTASSTPKKASSTAEKKSSTPKKSNSEQASAGAGKKSTKTAADSSSSKKKQTEDADGDRGSEPATPQSNSSGEERADSKSITPGKKKSSEDSASSPKPGIPGQPSPPLPMKEGSSEEANTSAAGTETPSKEPPTPAPDATASKEADDAPATTKKGKVAIAPNVSLAPEDLLGFELQPARVQQLIKSALDLARQKLTYTYGSADPANGGMDCSGAIHYLLTSYGFKDVPRDASGQYVWARKHGQFFAVVSKKADSFEFGDLLPGDLLFWNGTYSVQRDPPVTHTMIYLGVQRKRAQHVMWGASDGRTYDGKPRWGVSVFDFKMPRVDRNALEPAKADFLGYARIPGLRE